MPALRVFAYTLLAASSGLGAQAATVKRADDIGKVTWASCDVPEALNGTECGSIMYVLSLLPIRQTNLVSPRYCSVPLDYFNASAGTAKIALTRYKATKSPKKGMVMWNPGGPGELNERQNELGSRI